MSSTSSAKHASGTKTSHAKTESGQDCTPGFDCSPKRRGAPLVASMYGESTPDEPTPTMPGPQEGFAKAGVLKRGGTCSTCKSVPFSGPLTIALLSLLAIVLSFSVVVSTHIIQAQQSYLDLLSSQSNNTHLSIK